MSQGAGINGVDPELQRVRRESRDCQTCGGEGQIIVFHPRWDGRPVGLVSSGRLDCDGKPIRQLVAMEVSAHCICALGRWMRERIDDESRRAIPDVEAITLGMSGWLLDPPGDAQDDAGRVFGSVKVESIIRDMKSNLGAFTAA